MKRGQLRLLFFEIVLLLILGLNSFIPSILKGYNIIFLLIGLIALFKILFGYEKSRRRYVKDIIYELIIILIIFFILFYLSGIFVGFVKSENYYTLYGIRVFVIPIILNVIIKEFLRYNILMKSEGSKLLLIMTVIIFIMFDLVNIVNIKTFSNFYNTFLSIGFYILPTIANNILCTYLALRVGYKPNIIFLLIIKLYPYLIPLTPNINEYVYSIIFLWFPFIILHKISLFFKKEDDEYIPREYNKKNLLLYPITICIVIVITYFISGYFHYTAIVIGSGSMSPNIKKGDLVIIEKLNNNENLEIDQIIAFKYEGVIVVHRLVKFENTEEGYTYYTKGDANEKIDNWVITNDMLIGKVRLKIPYIGLPSTWLNDL